MKRYIDLDEAITTVIDVSREYAVDEGNDETISIIAKIAADTIFALMHLDRKEE